MTESLATRPGISLRSYQIEGADAVEAAWQRGVRRPLVAWPTGCGKTLLFGELIRRAQERGGKRALVVAHREELLQQASDKIRLVAPGFECGLVRADSDEHQAPVVIASVQTLSRPERLRRVAADFGVVVIDEAHHCTPGSTYARLLSRFEDAPALGVTATPERADRARLRDVWDEIVHRRTLPQMIRSGYLCDLRALRVGQNAEFDRGLALDLDRVSTSGGDFSEADLERELAAADAPRYVAQAYLRHAEGRKALLFTAGVRLAHEMAEALQASGVPAAAVDAATPREERARLLRAFRAGDIRVLANCGVLTEGYDEPSVEALLLVRPTKSRVLFAQMVGRGTRRHPGKQDCLILDLIGAGERHDLAGIGELFGFEPPADSSVLEGLEAIERQEAGARRGGGPGPDGDLTARTIELFDARSFAWACGYGRHAGLYALPAGDRGRVALQQVDDGWRVWHTEGREQRLVANGLDLEYAQGVAEDLARQMGALVLARRGSEWRSLAASENQLHALNEMGVEVSGEITRGEASDLLSLEATRRDLLPPTSRQLWAWRAVSMGADPSVETVRLAPAARNRPPVEHVGVHQHGNHRARTTGPHRRR